MGGFGSQLYANNKLWFQTWLTELNARLLANPEFSHIIVNGCHPGLVNSGVWNLNQKSRLEPLLKMVARRVAISPQQGSLTILYTATSEDAGTAGGRYFNRIWEEETLPHTTDPDCRCRVWRKVNEELDAESKGLLQGL